MYLDKLFTNKSYCKGIIFWAHRQPMLEKTVIINQNKKIPGNIC